MPRAYHIVTHADSSLTFTIHTAKNLLLVLW